MRDDFLCVMNEYPEDRIEVRSYFRKGGKVVGTERCDTTPEAVVFAKHQLNYYRYVEIVYLHGMVSSWGYKVKSSEVLYTFGC